jgi:hypothetical protein
MNRTIGRLVLLLSGIFIIMVVVWSPAGASTFTGIASDTANGVPFPDPKFGTLINFDDKADGTILTETAYASLGVESIRGSSGEVLAVFAFSPQSVPNYLLIEPTFSGTIQITFKDLQSRVGIGITDSTVASPKTLKVFDSIGGLLEQFDPTFNNSSIYAGFEESAPIIKSFEISGNVFAVDDLQFSPLPRTVTTVPEPAPWPFLIVSLVGLWLLIRRPASSS